MSFRSFESVLGLLSESDDTSHYRTLDSYFGARLSLLQSCGKPIPGPSEVSKSVIDKDSYQFLGSPVEITPQIRNDASQLSQLLNIDQVIALEAVLVSPLITVTDERLRALAYVSSFYAEKRALIKLVHKLIALKADPGTLHHDVAKKYANEILVDERFPFTIISAIKTASSTQVLDVGIQDFSDMQSSQILLEEELYLRLFFTLLLHEIPASPSLMIDWFKLLGSNQFLTEQPVLALYGGSPDGLAPIIYMALAISINLFNIPGNYDIDLSSKENSRYVTSIDTLQKLNDIITNELSETYPAMPLSLAWSFILFRLSFSDLSTLHDPDREKLEDILYLSDNKSAAHELASRSLQNGALSVLNQATTTCPDDLNVKLELFNLLTASLSFMAFTESVATAYALTFKSHDALVNLFFEDSITKRAALLCRSKIPLDLGTFIRLTSGLGVKAYEFVRDCKRYTQMMPIGFNDFDLSTHDPSIIILRSSLIVFSPRLEDNEGAIVIPPGTTGALISSESGQPCVVWNYSFNGWSFLGRIIEHSSLSGSQDDIVPQIIKLFSNTIEASTLEDTEDILLAGSDLLGIGGDVIDSVMRILNDALQSKELTTAGSCLDFLKSIVQSTPERIWSYLDKSSLLSRLDHEGAAVQILSSIEIVNGDFEFSIKVLELLDALVEDAIERPGKDEVSRKLKNDVLIAFFDFQFGVFESLPYWRYKDFRQRTKMATVIASSTLKVIEITCTTEDAFCSSPFYTSILSNILDKISEFFLSKGEESQRAVAPILAFLNSAVKSLDALQNSQELIDLNQHCIQVFFTLTTQLIRLRSIKKFQISTLEERLFSSAPDLTNIYVSMARLRPYILKLLTRLVSAQGFTDPPSLLAHLGHDDAKLLSRLLIRTVDDDMQTAEIQILTAKFLSAIVTCGQEGLSVLLLTGDEIGVNTRGNVEKSGQSLYGAIERKALSMKDLSHGISNALFAAVTVSQSNWSLLSNEHKEHVDAVIKSISSAFEFVDIPIDSSADKSVLLNACHGFTLAATTAEFCAIEIQKLSVEKRSKERAAFLDQILNYLSQDSFLQNMSDKALHILGYRHTLHQNLQKNLGRKWRGANLRNFRRLDLSEVKYGESFAYNLEIMDKVFGHDSLWKGYRQEIIHANLNLSLIDSQMKLARSWALLLTTLCQRASTKPGISSGVLSAAKACLLANCEEGISDAMFAKIFVERLDLAFLILNKVTPSDSQHSLFASILTDTWNVLNLIDLDFLAALRQNKHILYRPVLRILLLSLRKIDRQTLRPQVLQVINGIFNLVVAKGFRSLIGSAHSNPNCGAAEDMVLVISIMRQCFNYPSIDAYYGNMASLVVDNGTSRAAISLFSYAHELIVNNDIIYGELSIFFLLELSKVDIIAEQLAMEGILNAITESTLSVQIQTAQQPLMTTNPRLYNIWVNGLLPLVLNMLLNVGPRLLPEVVLFVRFYGRLIDSAFISWQQPKLITYSSVREISLLVYLLEMMTRLSEFGSQVGIGPTSTTIYPINPSYQIFLPAESKAELQEALSYILVHPKYLLSRIVPTTIEERNMLDTPIGESNKLALKISSEITELRDLISSEQDSTLDK